MTRHSRPESMILVVHDVEETRDGIEMLLQAVGFVLKHGTSTPDLALFENAAALVEVKIAAEADVAVTYLTGSVVPAKQVKQVFRYTSGPAYMKNGEPAVLASYRPVSRAG